jgi:glycosyltransferase involved in cell wall biosynthesis
MVIINTSYSKTASFNDPVKWLNRISFFTGILEELAKEHTVISLERINYQGELFQKGVRYKFIQQAKEVEIFPNRMHAIIKKYSPDIILINGFIFPLQLIQLRFQIGPNTRIIIINRSEKPGTGWRGWLQKMADAYVSNYLFASKTDAGKWTDKGIIKNSNKIREVMHASSNFQKENKKAAREKLKIGGSPIYLWVGRLDANKDPLTVVKAFLQFIQAFPDARLYMIFQQDDLLNEVIKLIKDSGAKKNIYLEGNKEHSELGTWYSAADFVISGSHYEGGGIAIIEAMSCGAIPIITRIPSFIKMTDQGKYGLLYEPGNSAALHSLLLLTPDTDIEGESQKVMKRFQNEFSFKAIAGKINAIIRDEK